MKDDLEWSQKYRPKTIETTILPKYLKDAFRQFVDKKEIPNLLLVGKAGVGKTTVAKAMLDELGADYYIVNGSLNGNIDTLRNEIQQFASSVSFSGGRKYVILDEADYLNPNSTQPALRNFMEEYSKNCGFILTANYASKIIEPLHSRTSLVEFKIPKEEKNDIAKQIYKRVVNILKNENITFDKAAVQQLIVKYFPDFRRIINELQYWSNVGNGNLTSVILTPLDADNFQKLIGFLKDKNFTSMRKWVAENDSDVSTIFKMLYEKSPEILDVRSIPQMVLHLAEYQYKSAFVVDQEINTVACLTHIMLDCLFL